MSDHLEQWETFLYAEGKALRTVQDRIATMQRFERARGSLLDATPRDVAAWLSQPHLSAVSKSTQHSMFRAFYRWAVTQGLRPDDPTVTIRAARRPKGSPRPIAWSSFRRLVDSAPTDELRAMVLLGGYAGLRVHEIAQVHGRDLDAEAGTLTVTGKGGGTFTLPAHHELIEVAARMPRGYWFPSQRASHVERRTIWQRLRLHMLSQGVNATPHQLRHTYATQLVTTGADLRVVQELMRHASLQTTARYTAVADDRKRAAIERLAS